MLSEGVVPLAWGFRGSLGFARCRFGGLNPGGWGSRRPPVGSFFLRIFGWSHVGVLLLGVKFECLLGLPWRHAVDSFAADVVGRYEMELWDWCIGGGFLDMLWGIR